MVSVNKEKVEQKINNFLDEKSGLSAAYEKLKKAQEKLENAYEDGDEKKIQSAEKVLDNAKQSYKEACLARQEKYSLDTWMDKAANSMAKSLDFSTHLSKGIHPDSKGDNINFQGVNNLPEGYAGSQSLPDPVLDASGAATALPLAGLLNIKIEEQVTLKDLIISNDDAIQGVFANDPEKSKEYAEIFQRVFQNNLDQPKTDGVNKQILWPLSNEAISDDQYINLIPLYPSSLTEKVYQSIQSRYSDANKQAKDNRRKKTAEQQPYFIFFDLAKINLGGANPQNVSQLMAKNGGVNFLLPSLPPSFTNAEGNKIKNYNESVFNRRLYYSCKEGFEVIFKVIESDEDSNKRLRQKRKEGMNLIIGAILKVAYEIQTLSSPGWSSEYSKLNQSEKYWLDPGRSDIDKDFNQERENFNWVEIVKENFARWVNSIINKKRVSAYELGDNEIIEWKREMEEAIKASQRENKGLF